VLVEPRQRDQPAVAERDLVFGKGARWTGKRDPTREARPNQQPDDP